jgi:hypothetical protein
LAWIAVRGQASAIVLGSLLAALLASLHSVKVGSVHAVAALPLARKLPSNTPVHALFAAEVQMAHLTPKSAWQAVQTSLLPLPSKNFPSAHFRPVRRPLAPAAATSWEAVAVSEPLPGDVHVIVASVMPVVEPSARVLPVALPVTSGQVTQPSSSSWRRTLPTGQFSQPEPASELWVVSAAVSCV